MKVLWEVLLGVLVAAVAFQVADAGVEKAAAAAGGTITKILIKLAELPLKIAKTGLKLQFNTLVKLPFALISNLVRVIVKIVGTAENLSAKAVSEIISLVKQIIAQIVDVLVEIGVLQGKTVEQVISSVQKIIVSVIELFVKSELKITSTVVDTIEKFLKGLNIKGLIKKIANLPFIKEIVKLITDIRSFILNNFKKQIDDIKHLIKSQIEKHKDFFQPIFDGISSRILIVSNALHALVNGDLKACLGATNPESSPSGSLKWELNILIDKVRINLLKVLGFTKLAGEVQEKLDIISTEAPPLIPAETSLPPVMASLAASSSPTTPKPDDMTTTQAPEIPKTDPPEDPTTAEAPSEEMMPTEAPEGSAMSDAPGTPSEEMTTMEPPQEPTISHEMQPTEAPEQPPA